MAASRGAGSWQRHAEYDRRGGLPKPPSHSHTPLVVSRETSTSIGRAAKRFVEERVRAGDEVVLSTTKPDKYDRSLADVFLAPAASAKLAPESPEPAAEFFLNNALLQNGHAVRYDGGPKE